MVCLMALAVLPGGATAVEVPDTGAIEVRGAGTWGVAGQAPANATWLVIDGLVHAYSVTDDTGARSACHIATAASDRHDGGNGSDSENATRHEGCTAEKTDNGTYHFRLQDQGQNHEGWFVAEDVQTLLRSEGPHPAPSSLAGFIVSTLAALFLVTSIILLVLYMQERRVSHYLVRRLYEETKGRMPPDWPENLRHQWIARIFIRGKN